MGLEGERESKLRKDSLALLSPSCRHVGAQSQSAYGVIACESHFELQIFGVHYRLRVCLQMQVG